MATLAKPRPDWSALLPRLDVGDKIAISQDLSPGDSVHLGKSAPQGSIAIRLGNNTSRDFELSIGGMPVKVIADTATESLTTSVVGREPIATRFDVNLSSAIMLGRKWDDSLPPEVSREHLRLTLQYIPGRDGGYLLVVEDLNSRNGSSITAK